MRLWHYSLIEYLSNKHLLGQHRECAALRGMGWGKKHSVVDYVFNNSYSKLFSYHKLIMKEMEKRKYNVSLEWKNIQYRGKKLGIDNSLFTKNNLEEKYIPYKEHDNEYLSECLENLNKKGFTINKKEIKNECF